MVIIIPIVKALFSRSKSIPKGEYLLNYKEIEHKFMLIKVYFTKKVPNSKMANDGSYYMTFISRRNDLFEILYGIWYIMDYYDIYKYMRKDGLTMRFDDVYQIKVDNIYDTSGSLISSGGFGVLVKRIDFLNAKVFKKVYSEDGKKPAKVKAEGSIGKLTMVKGYDLDYLISSYQLYPKIGLLISNYDKYFVLM